MTQYRQTHWDNIDNPFKSINSVISSLVTGSSSEFYQEDYEAATQLVDTVSDVLFEHLNLEQIPT